MIPYGRQYIDNDDIEAVVAALKGDMLTTGPHVEQFEQALCIATGSKHAIACANGTVALHLACMALNLSAGDAVIVPSITFLATANAPRYCGAEVIFSDVDPKTGLLTPETCQQALERAEAKQLNVRAIFPVHLTGRPVNLIGLSELVAGQNIDIIADSCHAIGGWASGLPVGAGRHEVMSTFSFHPVKTIATGEGGAVTTNSAELAEKMRTIRHHNMRRLQGAAPWEYQMVELGYNYRMTDIQCALGITQLGKLEKFIEKRQRLVDIYNGRFDDISPLLHIPTIPTGESQYSWHLYAPRIDFERLGKTRQQVMLSLKDKGIGTQVHYIPVHTQPYYVNLYGSQHLPGAETYFAQTLSLPLFVSMTENDVHYIADIISEMLLK